MVALAFTAARRRKLDASHQVLPERLRPGTVGQVVLTLTNVGTSRTRPLDVTEPPTADLTAGLKVHAAEPAARPAPSQAVYRLYAIRRGRFLLGPPRIRISDPFGLWEDNQDDPGPDRSARGSRGGPA